MCSCVIMALRCQISMLSGKSFVQVSLAIEKHYCCLRVVFESSRPQAWVGWPNLPSDWIRWQVKAYECRWNLREMPLIKILFKEQKDEKPQNCQNLKLKMHFFYWMSKNFKFQRLLKFRSSWKGVPLSAETFGKRQNPENPFCFAKKIRNHKTIHLRVQ